MGAWSKSASSSRLDVKGSLVVAGAYEACGVYLDQLRPTIEIVHDAGSPEEFDVDPQRVDALATLFRAEREM
jgi:hypothetical protein